MWGAAGRPRIVAEGDVSQVIHISFLMSLSNRGKLGKQLTDSLYYFRVEGQQELYNARMYRVENDWRIDIKVDKDTKISEVFKVNSDGTKELLTPWDTHEISTEHQSSGSSNLLPFLNFTVSLADFIMRIIENS